MPDERLRELERQWRETGDSAAGMAWAEAVLRTTGAPVLALIASCIINQRALRAIYDHCRQGPVSHRELAGVLLQSLAQDVSPADLVSFLQGVGQRALPTVEANPPTRGVAHRLCGTIDYASGIYRFNEGVQVPAELHLTYVHRTTTVRDATMEDYVRIDNEVHGLPVPWNRVGRLARPPIRPGSLRFVPPSLQQEEEWTVRDNGTGGLVLTEQATLGAPIAEIAAQGLTPAAALREAALSGMTVHMLVTGGPHERTIICGANYDQVVSDDRQSVAYTLEGTNCPRCIAMIRENVLGPAEPAMHQAPCEDYRAAALGDSGVCATCGFTIEAHMHPRRQVPPPGGFAVLGGPPPPASADQVTRAYAEAQAPPDMNPPFVSDAEWDMAYEAATGQAPVPPPTEEDEDLQCPFCGGRGGVHTPRCH